MTDEARRRIERALAQAAHYRRYLDELQAELVRLTGDPDPDFGLCFDAVWTGGVAADDLSIRVAEQIARLAR